MSMASKSLVTKQELSAMGFVQLIRDRCLRTGEPSSIAARALFDPVEISVAAIHELAIRGASFMAADLEHYGRGTAAMSGRNGHDVHAGPSSKEKVGLVLDTIRHMGVDGKSHSLLTFSVEDWQEFGKMAGAKAAGWRARQSVAKKAVTLLETHKVLTAEALPINALQELDAKAAQAW